MADVERATTRWHEAVDHTADVGIRAGAADLPALLEEAALALARLAADVDRGVPCHEEPVEVRGADPAGLAYGWLNELIGVADARGEALVDATVTAVTQETAGWVLRGRARTAAVDGERVRSRLGVKAATYHRLRVERAPEGWTLDAYLDV